MKKGMDSLIVELDNQCLMVCNYCAMLIGISVMEQVAINTFAKKLNPAEANGYKLARLDEKYERDRESRNI